MLQTIFKKFHSFLHFILFTMCQISHLQFEMEYSILFHPQSLLKSHHSNFVLLKFFSKFSSLSPLVSTIFAHSILFHFILSNQTQHQRLKLLVTRWFQIFFHYNFPVTLWKRYVLCHKVELFWKITSSSINFYIILGSLCSTVNLFIVEKQ